jgi:subtilase family serine protease
VAAAKPFHIAIGHVFAQPPTTADCQAKFHISCYSPNQYQKAYDMLPLYDQGLTGKGKTILIVDSFGSPTIHGDLKVFDQQFDLPDPPSLNVIQPAGPVPSFDPTNSDMVGWAEETTLDVEYAHAMAPGANIVLAETPVAETEGVTGLPEMIQSENYAINHHMADVITQSFGATEATFPNARSILNLRSAYFNALAHRVTVLAASGDAGPTDYTLNLSDLFPFRVNSWPSSDPLVTSVGGTQLHLDATGNRTAPDNVWNDTFDGNVVGDTPSPAASGGGRSAVFARPFYQNGVASETGRSRGTPDISMSAAVNGAAVVYLGFPGVTAGYHLIGGTSEASPLLSGVVAVADQAAHRDLGLLNPTLYGLGDRGPSGIDDVVGGDTTVQFTNTDLFGGTHTVKGFKADRGYDLATGLGTPDGYRLVGQLPRWGSF